MTIYGILLPKVFDVYSYLPSFYKVVKDRHKQDSISDTLYSIQKQMLGWE